MKPKLGFIGLGIMGRPMSKNLMKAGYELTVHNRSKSKVNELVTVGAKAANSPKEVAENSDVVITIVTDTPDVEQVILGENGVIEGARKEGYVYAVIAEKNKVTKRSIKFDTIYEDFLLVTSGLEEVDEVVTWGAPYLSETSLIDIVK